MKKSTIYGYGKKLIGEAMSFLNFFAGVIPEESTWKTVEGKFQGDTFSILEINGKWFAMADSAWFAANVGKQIKFKYDNKEQYPVILNPTFMDPAPSNEGLSENHEVFEEIADEIINAYNLSDTLSTNVMNVVMASVGSGSDVATKIDAVSAITGASYDEIKKIFASRGVYPELKRESAGAEEKIKYHDEWSPTNKYSITVYLEDGEKEHLSWLDEAGVALFKKKFPGETIKVNTSTDGQYLESNSVNESTNVCPVCSGKMVSQCRCGGPTKHTIEDLKKGHGMKCENGHQWSNNTADGKTIVLEAINIGPNGEMTGMDSDSVEVNDSDYEKYLTAILAEYGIDPKNGRILGGRNHFEYELPMSAKADLDKLGVFYEVDKATNREHPDFGKQFLKFTHLWGGLNSPDKNEGASYSDLEDLASAIKVQYGLSDVLMKQVNSIILDDLSDSPEAIKTKIDAISAITSDSVESITKLFKFYNIPA